MHLTQKENCQTRPHPSSFCRLNIPTYVLSSSAEETYTLGEKLSELLKKGSVVALNGPLGAGKTCFAKGIISGLGIKEEITSPSYTIISEYEIPETGRLYHIDAYRLGGNDDFSAIGGEEIIFGNGISIIEWSERIPDFIQRGAFKVDIQISEDDKRSINIYRENDEHLSS